MRKLIIPLLLVILALQMISGAWAIGEWEIERPGNPISIKERVENAATNGEASVGLGVGIDDYTENGDFGYDIIHMNISMPANSRQGMRYANSWQGLRWISENDLWHPSEWAGAGDEAVIPVDIPQDEGPFAFRFYGGKGSGEYRKVYVSTNGFISFHSSTQPSPSPSYYFPYTSEPNAIIAAVWTDLDIDSSASIFTGLYPIEGIWYFVIMWNNALHKESGLSLTFEIILGQAPEVNPAPSRFSQSEIWISYKSVSSINTAYDFGIENQQGNIGLGEHCSGSSLGSMNGQSCRFYQYSNSFFLKKLTISLQDSETQTEFEIWEENGFYLRGTNIQWDQANPSQADAQYMFLKALSGTAVLLLMAATVAHPVTWVAAAGIIVDTVFVTSDWVEFLAYSQTSARKFDVFDRNDPGWQQKANATALANDYAVDACASIIADWVLKDQDPLKDHSLTITAILEYYEYSITNGGIINKPALTTSVNLRTGPDHNNNPDAPQEISAGSYTRLYIGPNDQEDYYKIYVDKDYTISVSAWATRLDPSCVIEPYFYLVLYDTGGHHWTVGPGKSLYLSRIANSSGYYKIEVRLQDIHGFYSLKVSLYPPQGDGDGGGGGCPYVSTWNGSQYVLDNNLIPGAERSNGTDVTDYYMLQRPLIRNDGKYSLLIWDLDKHSFLDQVRLLAVDHESDVNIAVSPYGEILTYRNPAALVAATDQNGQDVTSILSSADGDYFEGYAGDYVMLDFGSLDVSQGAKLVFRADGGCEWEYCKESIHVQVSNADGEWVNVASFIPRIYWSTDIIDMSDYLPDINGDLRVRLYCTAHHKIDYVGLDTSKQGEFETRYANLAEANHSRLGEVKEILVYSDDQRAELLPSESIALEFTLPQNTEEKRDFIIMLEGHYFIMG